MMAGACRSGKQGLPERFRDMKLQPYLAPHDYPATARQARTAVTVETSEDLLDEAERPRTNLTAVAEQALEAAIRDARRAKWREENSEAIKEANEELAQNGLWSDGLRLF